MNPSRCFIWLVIIIYIIGQVISYTMPNAISVSYLKLTYLVLFPNVLAWWSGKKQLKSLEFTTLVILCNGVSTSYAWKCSQNWSVSNSDTINIAFEVFRLTMHIFLISQKEGRSLLSCPMWRVAPSLYLVPRIEIHLVLKCNVEI